MTQEREYTKPSEDVTVAVNKLIAHGIFDPPVEVLTAYYTEYEYSEPDTFDIKIDRANHGISLFEDFCGKSILVWEFKDGLSRGDATENNVLGVLEEVLEKLQDFQRQKDSGIIVDHVDPDDERVFGILRGALYLSFPRTHVGDQEAITKYLHHIERFFCSATLGQFKKDRFFKGLRTSTVMVKVDTKSNLDHPVALLGLVKYPVDSVDRDTVFLNNSLHNGHLRTYKVLGKEGEEGTGKVDLFHTLQKAADGALRGVCGYGDATEPRPLLFVDDGEEDEFLTAIHLCQVKQDAEVESDMKDKIVWTPFSEVNLSQTTGLTNLFINYLDDLVEESYDPNRTLIILLNLKVGF
jgi:hypothetical protein